MTSRSSLMRFLGLLSACAAGLGCHSAQPLTQREGGIDFVVRQGSLGGPKAVVGGSFDVRGLDTDERAHVGIGHGASRTLHVRLPPGAYSISWKPELFATAAPAAPSAAEAAGPRVVVVTAGQATIVDVVLGSKGARGPSPVELASAGARAAL